MSSIKMYIEIQPGVLEYTHSAERIHSTTQYFIISKDYTKKDNRNVSMNITMVKTCTISVIITIITTTTIIINIIGNYRAQLGSVFIGELGSHAEGSEFKSCSGRSTGEGGDNSAYHPSRDDKWVSIVRNQ